MAEQGEQRHLKEKNYSVGSIPPFPLCQRGKGGDFKEVYRFAGLANAALAALDGSWLESRSYRE
jgi:hypothetical protein